MRYLAVFAFIAATLVGIAGPVSAQGMFPGYPAATLPLTGNETIPADTNLSGGRQPATELITVNQLQSLRQVTLTGTGTMSIDASQGTLWYYDMNTAGTIGIATPTNLISGKQMTFIFAGQGTNTTLNWDSDTYLFPAGIQWAPTTTAGRRNVYSFIYDGSKLVGATVTTNIFR